MDASVNGVGSGRAGAVELGAKRPERPALDARPIMSPVGQRAEPAVQVLTRTALSDVGKDMSVALAALDRAVAAGRNAGPILAEAEEIVRAGALAPEIEELMRRYDAALDEGGPLLKGNSIFATIDPRTPAVEIEGIDVSRAAPVGEGVDALKALQTLRGKLDGALSALSEQGGRLGAHGGLVELLSAQLRSAVSIDLDAEEARLTALQVGQSLAESAYPAANAAPHAILSLFRD